MASAVKALAPGCPDPATLAHPPLWRLRRQPSSSAPPPDAGHHLLPVPRRNSPATPSFPLRLNTDAPPLIDLARRRPPRSAGAHLPAPRHHPSPTQSPDPSCPHRCQPTISSVLRRLPACGPAPRRRGLRAVPVPLATSTLYRSFLRATEPHPSSRQPTPQLLVPSHSTNFTVDHGQGDEEGEALIDTGVSLMETDLVDATASDSIQSRLANISSQGLALPHIHYLEPPTRRTRMEERERGTRTNGRWSEEQKQERDGTRGTEKEGAR